MNGSGSGVVRSSSSAGDLGSSPVVRATEGWLELFLTPPEKYFFSRWEEIIRDRSLVHNNTRWIFQYLATFLPDNLAPNVITLAGFLLLGNAWYITNTYGEYYPIGCTVLCCIHIFLFFIFNSLTGLHADRIRQHTALSDFFKYACDSASTVWLLMLTTYCLGASLETQWYAVQASQLVLLLKHLSAFKRHAGLRYSPTAGPGEVLMTCNTLLVARVVLGLDHLQQIYDKVMFSVMGILDMEYELTGGELVRLTYYTLFVASVVQALRLQEPHGWTRFGLTSSLMMRLVPALLLQWDVSFPLIVMDVVCDGFFLAVLTSDLILAKMSNRELHAWVVLMSLAAVLSYSTILILVAVYYVAVFSDLCFYLNLPLLATCRNVYCDGIYDLCHIGHKRAFQNALSLGNRLLVGVVGDEDASHYKRPPVMSHAERCAEVEACKAVTKVIQNAPCFGLTQAFLDEHQIHVVAFGEEYLTKYKNPDDDPYYGYVRKIGIAYPLPRTNTLSTTDLIERIHKASLEKNSPT
jgi:choline-phosphate cytidylyltransferase